MELKRRTLYTIYTGYFSKIKRTWNERAQYINKTLTATKVIVTWDFQTRLYRNGEIVRKNNINNKK